jgi:hypothetical protein
MSNYDIDLIKALKQNEKPYGLMSWEMQEGISGRRDNSDIEYYTDAGEWKPVNEHGIPAVCDATYRLRPDYEEKPEIVEMEVFMSETCLKYKASDNCQWSLSYAINKPDFIGFKYEDGNIYPQPVMYSENGGLHFISQIESFISGKDIANRPTHVLFQRSK